MNDPAWTAIEVYEAWGYPEGHENEDESIMVALPTQAKKFADEGMVALYSMRGTWVEVMTAHNEIQGWQPYVPMTL